MALAEFFGRVGDSAAQVLANYDQAAFARRLDECAVTIAFDCSINSAEGGLLYSFPRIAGEGRGWGQVIATCERSTPPPP